MYLYDMFPMLYYSSISHWFEYPVKKKKKTTHSSTLHISSLHQSMCSEFSRVYSWIFSGMIKWSKAVHLCIIHSYILTNILLISANKTFHIQWWNNLPNCMFPLYQRYSEHINNNCLHHNTSHIYNWYHNSNNNKWSKHAIMIYHNHS